MALTDAPATLPADIKVTHSCQEHSHLDTQAANTCHTPAWVYEEAVPGRPSWQQRLQQTTK
jgi:hypothetical protein